MASAQHAHDLAVSCDPIPYLMGGMSRNGIDCSGFMALIRNDLKDAELWVRRFGTGTIRDVYTSLGFVLGQGNLDTDFEIGVMYPWESPSGIGHTAGTIRNFNVESRGGAGVVLGPLARGSRNSLFNHHFHIPLGEDDVSAADVITALKSPDGKAAFTAAFREAWDTPRIFAATAGSPNSVLADARDKTNTVLGRVNNLPEAQAIATAVVAALPQGQAVSAADIAREIIKQLSGTTST